MYNPIIEFIERHTNITGYWKILAKYYAKDDRLNDAIKILESKCTDYRYDNNSVIALELLKEIYINADDKRYVDCIERLIFNYTYYSDENMSLLKEYYKKLWPEKKNEIMNYYKKTDKNNMLDLLLFDEEYESFKNIIFESPDIYTLHRYEKILKKMYPSELLNAYKKIILNILKEAKLKNYLDACNILEDMKKIPDSENIRTELIKYLITLYPRRSRMIEEFEKLL